MLQNSVDDLVGNVLPRLVDLLDARERAFSTEYAKLRMVRDNQEAVEQAVSAFWDCVVSVFFFVFVFLLRVPTSYPAVRNIETRRRKVQ